MHRVFVTGGTGFVGRAVVSSLRAEGHIVRCLVRRGSERDLRGLESIERVEGDVRSLPMVESAMAGCDTVIHLVGIIREHPGRGMTFDRLHVGATGNVLTAAARNGVRRFLHMSALGARPGAPSRYHDTKWRAEEAVRASSFDWTIFRPSVIYGPQDGFVTPLARVVRRVPLLPLIGTGDIRLQPVPLEHVAEAFSLAVNDSATVRRTFDAGGPEPVTLNQLIDIIAAVVGRRRVRKVPLPVAPVAVVTRVLQGLAFYPISTDQLLMLSADNTCDPLPFLKAFGLSPIPLAKGIERALGR
jgi:NADH dehydrogenase